MISAISSRPQEGQLSEVVSRRSVSHRDQSGYRFTYRGLAMRREAVRCGDNPIINHRIDGEQSDTRRLLRDKMVLQVL